jgi:hypothetical protein
MPILVGISVLSVFSVPLINSAKLKSITTIFIVFYCFFSFWGVTFGYKFLPKELKLGPIIFFAQRGYSTASPPTTGQWHQEDIFKFISQYPESERSLRSDCLDTMYWNNWGLMYYAVRYGVRLTFNNEKTTFLVERKQLFSENPPDYKLIQKFELPDKSILKLFKTGR